MQVLDAIAPPYTPEFVQLVLPMVENEEITGTMRAEGENDPVSEFIGLFSSVYTYLLIKVKGIYCIQSNHKDHFEPQYKNWQFYAALSFL